MPPLKTHDFKIKQGEYYEETLEYKQADGSPVVLDGPVRLVARYKDQVVADLTSSPAAGITVDAPNGRITYAFSAALTSGWAFNFAPYDVFYYPASGKPVCLEEGIIELARSQTR